MHTCIQEYNIFISMQSVVENEMIIDIIANDIRSFLGKIQAKVMHDTLNKFVGIFKSVLTV
jgi:hypothetical protein